MFRFRHFLSLSKRSWIAVSALRRMRQVVSAPKGSPIPGFETDCRFFQRKCLPKQELRRRIARTVGLDGRADRRATNRYLAEFCETSFSRAGGQSWKSAKGGIPGRSKGRKLALLVNCTGASAPEIRHARIPKAYIRFAGRRFLLMRQQIREGYYAIAMPTIPISFPRDGRCSARWHLPGKG